MTELKIKNKEIAVTLQYSEPISGPVSVQISGQGDLSHHLIEGLFDIIDKLARMERCSHQSEEWEKR